MASTWTWCTRQSHDIRYPQDSRIKQLRHGFLVQTRPLKVHLQQNIETTIINVAIIAITAVAIDLARRFHKLGRSNWKFLPRRGYFRDVERKKKTCFFSSPTFLASCYLKLDFFFLFNVCMWLGYDP